MKSNWVMLTGKKLGDALNTAIQMKGVSKVEVARHFNIKPPSVQGWIKYGRISKTHIQRLIAYFSDVVGPEHWGVTSESFAGAFKQTESDNITLATIGARKIPLISYIQAGQWTEVVNSHSLEENGEFLLTNHKLSSSAFALRIKGDSMLPDFCEGDVIIIDPTVMPHPGDFVAAKNSHEEATFKKYRHHGINNQGQPIFELVPLNSDYPSMRSDMTEIQIIGTMIEHRRYRRK